MPSNMTFEVYDSLIYHYFLSASGVIAAISGFLGMYFTLFKSPPSFGHYKYFLFNICFWSFMNDFYFTVIYRPKVMFPNIIICPTGILKTENEYWGYAAYCAFMVFFGATSISIISAFVYRYLTLKSNLAILLKPASLVTLGVLHLFYEAPSIILDIVAAIQYKDKFIAAIVKDYPNIAKYLIGQGCAVLHISFGITFAYIIACFFGIGLGIPISSFFIYKCFSKLRAQRQYMSSSTFRLQKNLLISLVFQLLAPVCGLFGPFLVVAYLCFIGGENLESYGMTAMICGTFHSFLNTVMMVYFVPHYRRTFSSIILKKHITPSSADNLQRDRSQIRTNNHTKLNLHAKREAESEEHRSDDREPDEVVKSYS